MSLRTHKDRPCATLLVRKLFSFFSEKKKGNMECRPCEESEVGSPFGRQLPAPPHIRGEASCSVAPFRAADRITLLPRSVSLSVTLCRALNLRVVWRTQASSFHCSLCLAIHSHLVFLCSFHRLLFFRSALKLQILKEGDDKPFSRILRSGCHKCYCPRGQQ